MIGQILDGRYRVIQSLGAGGFGHTYIAENTRIPGNPKCVVKQLKPASNDPNTFAIAKRLFHSEAETLAKVGNYNQIPTIVDFFDENQEFYLVQEYVEGHTLATELIPGKKLSEAYVIALLENILPILEFIHQQNPIVIHRDIKPANIIRRKQDGKLVLIDFGAVKEVQAIATTAQTQQSLASVAIGTPGYMPTEQGRGKPRPNSDIYALGMIAIQALTGLSPDNLEEDSQTGEMVWQHQASVSPGLAEVLTKMTRYHFKDRYQSTTEVISALQQLNNPTPAQTVIPNTVGYQPTQVATQAETQVHELTLEWREAGQLRTQIISDQKPTKNPGIVRIGRDPQACDIVLLEPTVSGLHLEIYFNQQQQRFYLRNLRQTNPPIVDGQPLTMGEVVLNNNSQLRLGQLELKVTDIAVKRYPIGYQATEYVSQPVNVPSYPVQATVQPSKGEDIQLTLEIAFQEASLGTSKEITFSRTRYINGNPHQETKKLIVNVSAYSQDGTRLQFAGQGNEGLYGGSPGDVYVRLVVSREVQPPAPPPVPPQPPKPKFPAWLARGLTTSAVILVAAIIRTNWNSWFVSNNSIPNDLVAQKQCVVVTGKNLNVRTTAGGQATGKLVQIGTNVTATGQAENGWIQISSPIEGWIWQENTTSDCSQAVTPNPGVIESTSNSESTSTTRNSSTPPRCSNGKPAEWFEAKKRYSCIGQDQDNNPPNTVDNTPSTVEKSSTDNPQSLSDCYEANENLSSAQREANCGCQPGYFYDQERAGCFPTKDNPSGEILN